MADVDLTVLLKRLSNREQVRTEADVQADVRTLLLYGDLQLGEADIVSLEAPVGKRKRIDVEAGTTVIEVKKDLRVGDVLPEAEKQLAGYVSDRSQEFGISYAGVLTDGAHWLLYHLRDQKLVRVGELLVAPKRPDVSRLTAWIEAIFSTASALPPSPLEINRRLGADSPSYLFDMAELRDLWTAASMDPESQIKRKLWADLVSTAQGTAFPDTDELFIQHSYLVIVAELIAHELIGLNPCSDEYTADGLLAGVEFRQSLVSNVVEADFFDWPAVVSGGPSFVKRLARRIHRFSWNSVEHDVLKVLYESVIGEEQRKQLGETYTPDWLAEAMIESAVDNPHTDTVHDPACGSGTFLFHAVRRHLQAAEDAGQTPGRAAVSVTNKVSGVDIHPVAVTLARVTYMLAIGHHRMVHHDRGPLSVPVYLGDSCQWGQDRDLFSSTEIRVSTAAGSDRYKGQLTFPRSLIANAQTFDAIVDSLVEAATSRPKTSSRPNPRRILAQFSLTETEKVLLGETFDMLCNLHESDQDGIWGYYVRNLVRPIWLAQQGNKVDVLVGNPPWLGYKFMSRKMQAIFKRESETRDLWLGGKYATQMDLSTYFVVRSFELYLRDGGRFCMVVPRSVLSREQYDGFRDGSYPLEDGSVLRATFDVPWDLFKVRPHFFPYPAAVVSGTAVIGNRKSGQPGMPRKVRAWQASLPDSKRSSWERVKPLLSERERPRAVVGDYSRHPYHPDFSQGAILVPRLLLSVKEEKSSKLGAGAGRIRVTSARSAYEKKPWSALPDISGVVEQRYVREFLAGEQLIPFGLRPGGLAVAPVDPDTGSLIDPEGATKYTAPGLSDWWKRAQGVWSRNTREDSMSLLDQVDYMHKLTNQYPLTSRRVVYNTSGMHLSAAYLENSTALIDSSLYWAPVQSKAEGMFLSAILNSDILEDIVAPLMASGKDERHFHKAVFALRWPRYNYNDPQHRALADLGSQAAARVSSLTHDSGYFITARTKARELLDSLGLTSAINDAVSRLTNEATPVN